MEPVAVGALQHYVFSRVCRLRIVQDRLVVAAQVAGIENPHFPVSILDGEVYQR